MQKAALAERPRGRRAWRLTVAVSGVSPVGSSGLNAIPDHLARGLELAGQETAILAGEREADLDVVAAGDQPGCRPRHLNPDHLDVRREARQTGDAVLKGDGIEVGNCHVQHQGSA